MQKNKDLQTQVIQCNKDLQTQAMHQNKDLQTQELMLNFQATVNDSSRIPLANSQIYSSYPKKTPHKEGDITFTTIKGPYQETRTISPIKTQDELTVFREDTTESKNNPKVITAEITTEKLQRP